MDDELRAGVSTWAWHETHRQLALLLARSKTADYFQLAYCIIIVASLQEQGKETPDQSLILKAAIEQLFDGQLVDGSWPRSRPLFHYPTVGNAYCYEYEMLAQLLQPSLQERLLPYLEHLARSVTRLREISFVLPDGGFGWSSGHHSQIEGPESWSTASVYHFAHVLDRLVAEAIRRSVFEYLETPYLYAPPPKLDRLQFAQGFLDCPLRYDGDTLSLKGVIYDDFVSLIRRGSFLIEGGGSLPSGTPMSAIFFGPPGTSKTELTRIIADYLGWPRLSIDPSHFVRKGLDQVQAEADRIFGMLAVSERIVVLLDEFDEMVRDRHQASELLSRFLTTAMLPKLAAINKSRRLVFIVATNYIDQFDLAISRPGRFDMIVQVMPPSCEEKLRHWSDVGARFRELAVSPTGDLEEKISQFTFDEFRTVVSAINNASSAQDAIEVINRLGESCTLESKFEPHASDTRRWRDVCAEQSARVRLPLRVGRPTPVRGQHAS